MTNWWDAAPVVQAGPKNWWDDAPVQSDLDRKAALGAQGTRVGILNTLGSPVDLVGGALGIKDPILGGKMLNQGADWLASLPGKVAPDLFSSGERLKPQTATERAIEGAGEGVGGVLATAVPGALLARAAAPMTRAATVGETLAARPLMQATAAATGGAVGGATENPYLGMAASLATPVALGTASRAVTPMGPAATASEAERRRLVDLLRSNDVPLQTGEILGSPVLQGVESVMSSLPFSGGLQRSFRNNQRQQANRLVTGTTGEPIDAFTPAARQARFGELGNEFETLARGTTVSLDPTFTNRLNDILTTYRQQLAPDIYRNVEQRLQELIGAATQPGNPQIPGEIYQRMRSSMSRQATSAGDPEVRDAMRGIRNELDAAARRSLPADVADQWDTVRTQWGNLRTIDNAMRGADAAVGDIPLKGLAAQVNTANRKGGARDLTDISNALSRVVADQLPQSGTQPRMAAYNLLTGGALLGGGGGAAALAGASGPATGGAALAALGIPPVAQVLLENPITRAWAANRMLGNVPTLPNGQLIGDLAINQAAAHDYGPEWQRRMGRLLQRSNEQGAR